MEKPITEICLIAPTNSLRKKAQLIIDENKENICIYEASLDNALYLAKSLAKQGIKIFISRRGTVTHIANNSNFIVVEIPSMMSDYLEVMDKIKGCKGLVAFFSYDTCLSDEVKTMCQLLDINAKHYAFKNIADTDIAVLEALKDGAQIGVGGALTQISAEKHGLKHFVLENSKDSICLAIEEAKRLLEFKKIEEKKSEILALELQRYKSVLEYTNDAIISIDNTGKIDVINKVAEKLLKLIPNTTLGNNIQDVLPSERILKTLKSDKAEVGYLVNSQGMSLYVNSVPIKVNGITKGVVSTLQDIKSIQKTENNIRVKLHNKGLVTKYSFSDIIGQDRSLVAAKEIAENYAHSNATVLIHGATGTGKEMFAQSICKAGERKNAPWVAINCATLEKNLLDSELFGYVEGAFTGALKGGKAGLFEIAHTGTLFLDEIAEMPVELQAKLLRVLQEKEIRRLGGSTVMPIDVRIIAATNKDLAKLVAEKTFREDLYYRLNVLNLYIPPLKNRRIDINELAEYFMTEFKCSSPSQIKYLHKTLQELKDYDWPGNIRELKNFVERIATMINNVSNSANLQILIDQLLNEKLRNKIPSAHTETENFSSWEKERIINTIKKNNGKLGKSAVELGISRTTLWRKIQEYNIQ